MVHEQPMAPDILPVRSYENAPPFVSPLLTAIRPDAIDEPMFDELVRRASPYTEKWLATNMVRQIDMTGMTPYLIGTAVTPEDTLVTLLPLASEQLDRIGRFDDALEDEIFSSLWGGRTSIRALMELDRIQSDMTDTLKGIMKGHPEAEAFRAANLKAIKNAAGGDVLPSPGGFLDMLMPTRSFTWLERTPSVTYRPKFDEDGRLVDVSQRYSLPDIPAKGTLLAILPKAFRRDTPGVDTDPKTPIGFLRRLGKVGHPLPRAIVGVVAEAREQAARKRHQMEADEAFRSWIESHP